EPSAPSNQHRSFYSIVSFFYSLRILLHYHLIEKVPVRPPPLTTKRIPIFLVQHHISSASMDLLWMEASWMRALWTDASWMEVSRMVGLFMVSS
ncbi:unnamed protein product, partial [Brassica oleracea var. botrytis]